MSDADMEMIISFLTQGTGAAYLAARLKRDHPEIAEKLAQGKFKSVRAAARAPQASSETLVPLAELRRWWKRASDQERAAFHRDIAYAVNEKKHLTCVTYIDQKGLVTKILKRGFLWMMLLRPRPPASRPS